MMTMPRVKPTAAQQDAWEDESQEEEFKPLTQQEAQQWRQRNPVQSPWRVVMWQWILLLSVVLVTWMLSDQAGMVSSAAYGGLCVAVPTAVMVYGLTASGLSRWVAKIAPGAAGGSLAGLFFWEGIKVLLAIAMMALAPSMVPDLNWLALVAGLVVVLKAYWLAFWTVRRSVT